MSDLGKDLRYAVQVLAKSPGFSLIVTGVLATTFPSRRSGRSLPK